MSNPEHAALGWQSLGRELTADELALARALEAIFITGNHDLAEAAKLLETKGVRRPSGSTEPWTLAALESELTTVNAALEDAYRKGQRVARKPAG